VLEVTLGASSTEGEQPDVGFQLGDPRLDLRAAAERLKAWCVRQALGRLNVCWK
jgi:hypothetical protein